MKDVANAAKTASTERKSYNRKNHNQDDNIVIPNFPLYNKTFFDVKEIFKNYLTFTPLRTGKDDTGTAPEHGTAILVRST